MLKINKVIKITINTALCLGCLFLIIAIISSSNAYIIKAGVEAEAPIECVTGADEPQQSTENNPVGEVIKPTSMPDEMYVNGVLHTPNRIPEDVDIEALDPSSPYVVDMIRRYIEGQDIEREQDALIKIAEKAGGINVDHPEYGYIEIGSHLKMERDPSYTPEYMKDGAVDINSEFYFDQMAHEFQNGTATEEERLELERSCIEKGRIVDGLQLYFLNPDVKDMIKAVGDTVKVDIKTEWLSPKGEYLSIGGYITVEDYNILKQAYDKYINEYALKNFQSNMKKIIDESPDAYDIINDLVSYTHLTEDELAALEEVLFENGWYYSEEEQKYCTDKDMTLNEEEYWEYLIKNGKPIRTEFTEEEKVIVSEKSEYFLYLVAYYQQLSDEEKQLCDEAMKMFGWAFIETP